MTEGKIIKQWKTKAGYDGVLYLMPMGFINGYVKIPIIHPYYKKDYTEYEYYLNPHGGVTFSSFPEWDKNNFYIGFDTAHLGDKSSVEILEKYEIELEDNEKEVLKSYTIFRHGTFRDEEYCTREVENLAKELREANNRIKKESWRYLWKVFINP